MFSVPEELPMRVRLFASLVLLPLLVCASACSSSKGSPATGTGDDGGAPAPDAATGTNSLEPPPAGQGIQYKMISALAAGQEIERVQFFQVPPEGLYVNREEVRYTPGSHHVLIYKTPYTTIPTVDERGQTHDTTGPIDAPNGGTGDWKVNGVIAGAQSADAPPIVDGLPPNVAVRLDGGTVILMNTHYINASTTALTVDARVNLWTIPKEQATVEAGIIFFYDPIIRVPAHSSGYAEMSCPVNADINVLNLQTHMHARGLGGQAFVLPPGTTQAPQMIYESTNWEQVPVKAFQPSQQGMQIKAGSTLNYHCNYQNDEDHTIVQGATTKDEMCMIIGVYYPRDAKTEMCSPDGTYDGLSLAGTWYGKGGTNTCGQALACAQAATTQDASYACLLGACRSATPALDDVAKCFFTQRSVCKTQCTADASPDTCAQTCLQKACGDKQTACQATGCN
jgi:Copper type II ascorbate-dependent monooxygenase, C-terminal domain